MLQDQPRRIERDHLGNFSKSLNASPLQNDIIDTLNDFAKTFEIAKLSYHHFPPNQARDFNEKHLFTRGYEQHLVNEYRRNHKIFNSPLSNYAKGPNDPITIRQAAKHLTFSSEQGSYLAKFYLSEHDTGLVIPVFGSHGRDGVFVLMSEKAGRTHDQDETRILKWACQETHRLMCKRRIDKTEETVSLSDRETEILTWVARGKSNSVIADIIGLSPHTINGYLRNVYLKTGVCDRTSAALVGLQKELITI